MLDDPGVLTAEVLVLSAGTEDAGVLLTYGVGVEIGTVLEAELQSNPML